MGLGFRPVLPFRGRGCGRRTAGRSACPVVGATGTPLHFPSSGKFRLYPCSSSPHKGHSPLRGPHLLVWEFRLPRNPRQTGANFGFSYRMGLLPYRSQKSPQSLGYGSKSDPRGLSVDRGQGCNNARTPGCSLAFIVGIAVLKNATGTLCNVATFMLPFSSTNDFRSCGFEFPECFSLLRSRYAYRFPVPLPC